MLLSTAFKIIWALWVLERLIETKRRAEAQDVDSMKWIVRVIVPLTYICSWLIWASFLKAVPGAYCPGNVKYINALWFLIPVLTNVMRAIVEVF
jgi:predicted outer membrane lipoprotein